MSIIIKSDQLNILIYKYLLQCNLTHTAYTLFNQGNLDQSLTQYKYDVKSGQLVSLIQKALIFSQIQSHITVNCQYQECKEGFWLLKPHVCKIVQKVKQQKGKLLQQLNQKVFATMRRTSSVHNTLQPNREFQQIIYQQRSANFLQKIPLRLADSQQLSLKISKGESVSQKYFCAYDAITMTVTIMTKRDNFLSTVGILPCRSKVILFQVIADTLICIFEHNECQVIKLNVISGFSPDFITFKLPLENACSSIKINKKLKHILTLQSDLEYVIINLNSKRQLGKGKGIFQWIDSFDYLVLDTKQKMVRRHSLKPEIIGAMQQFACPLNHPTGIKLSLSQIYFTVQSLQQNTVLVYNFDQCQPLYIFDFRQQSSQQQRQQNEPFDPQSSQQLKQVTWVTANSSDNLILVTDISIKTFEIQLNNFSKIIQISTYDSGQVREIGLLSKNQQQMYLVALGSQNLIFYDVSLGKIQRVQFSQDIQSISLVMLDQCAYLGIVMEDKICILQAADVEQLFM